MTTRPSRPSRLRAAALRNCRRIAAGASASLGAAALLVAAAGPSTAAPTFTVTDPSDAPDSNLGDHVCSAGLNGCTLRAAVMQAEHDGGGHIVLSSGVGDYTLSIPPGDESLPNHVPVGATGDLDISTPITVTGDGPANSVIAGNGTFRIFDVHFTGDLTLSGVTLQNGAGDPDGLTGHVHGGAIHNHGHLSLDHVAVINNGAATGGGITNAGAFGAHPAAQAQFVDVTVARNASTGRGGGIENMGAMQSMNVTVAENSAAAGQGGGVFDGATPSLSWNMGHELVAANSGGDCQLAGGPTVTSSGGNLAGDGSCGFTNALDRRGDPEFDTTVFGPPLWYPLQRSSPALDLGQPCFQDDIRGVWRSQDGDGNGAVGCDSGSYERETPAPGALWIVDRKTTEGQVPPKQITFDILAPGSLPTGAVLQLTTQDGTAHAGSDYVARTLRTKISPGQKLHFAVDLIPDTQVEPDETLKVQLSSSTGAPIDDGEAVGTILNDD
jgi:hypothetical protein